MFDMDTLVIILLPSSIGIAIILTVIIWIQDRYNTLTRKEIMIRMFLPKRIKEKRQRQIRDLAIRKGIESLKIYTSRKSVQDDLDAVGVVPFKMAELFLNEFADKHPIAKDKVADLLKLLQRS